METAVAATMSETVNVPVAIILSAIAHRLVRVWPALGGANPGLPVSNAMVVILRISCRHNDN
jgi:hypothetical protein